MITTNTKIQAAVLSLALMVPAGSAFARTRHHRHHYSQTRGVVVGAVAGAVIDHHKPLQGALIGGAVGGAVQAIRNHKQ
jgi:hypothetical protein